MLKSFHGMMMFIFPWQKKISLANQNLINLIHQSSEMQDKKCVYVYGNHVILRISIV